MRLLAFILALVTTAAASASWISTSDKRVLHLRTGAYNDAMFDIRCSKTYNILLGASYLTPQLDDLEFISGFIIDGHHYPNYLDPDSPPNTRASFSVFWESMRKAGDIIVIVDGLPRQVTTDNIYNILPDSTRVDFTCRPVTREGLLID